MGPVSSFAGSEIGVVLSESFGDEDAGVANGPGPLHQEAVQEVPLEATRRGETRPASKGLGFRWRAMG